MRVFEGESEYVSLLDVDLSMTRDQSRRLEAQTPIQYVLELIRSSINPCVGPFLSGSLSNETRIRKHHVHVKKFCMPLECYGNVHCDSCEHTISDLAASDVFSSALNRLRHISLAFSCQVSNSIKRELRNCRNQLLV